MLRRERLPRGPTGTRHVAAADRPRGSRDAELRDDLNEVTAAISMTAITASSTMASDLRTHLPIDMNQNKLPCAGSGSSYFSQHSGPSLWTLLTVLPTR